MNAGSLEIHTVKDEDVCEVIALWERCGLLRPWNNPEVDIAFCREKPNSTILVGRAHTDGPILGTAMTGHDGHRGWVYYLALDPAYQGCGLGRVMMDAVEAWQLDQGVWKLQLMVRRGNEAVIDFYKHLDYQESTCLLLEKWIDPSKRGDC